MFKKIHGLPRRLRSSECLLLNNRDGSSSLLSTYLVWNPAKACNFRSKGLNEISSTHTQNHMDTYIHTCAKTYTHAEMKKSKNSVYLGTVLYSKIWSCFLISWKKSCLSLSLPGICFQFSQAPNYKDGDSWLGEIGQTCFHSRHGAASRILTRNPL